MATETPEQYPDDIHAHQHSSAESLSPLEQEVLDEYARLLGNLNEACLSLLIPAPSPSLLIPSSHSIPSHSSLLLCSQAHKLQMSTLLSTLSATPSVEILDALRGLERKTSLVFTLLKASVYSIVLQQQINEDPDVDEGHGMGLGGSRGSGM
jgi:DASH complex subunit DAD3